MAIMAETPQQDPNGVKGAASKSARLDATTEAAREIVERQKAKQDAKTAKLRAARLAKDAG
jgi:hypothetical protein